MTSRRNFLTSSAAGLLTVAGRKVASASTTFPYTELESRMARRDFRDITKDVLPTPCMIIDLPLFEQNVRKMADYTKTVGINVRPHVKVHKSVDIARMQIKHGAIGLTCATIAEAELMSNAGCKNVLWTKQPASTNNVMRAVALTKRDPTFMFVVDDPLVANWVEQASVAERAKCRIAVSVFANMERQGIECGKPALELAQRIASSKSMELVGFMAYSGGAAHTKGFEARCKRSSDDLAGACETVELSRKAGLPVGFVSGGSTGTYNIDKNNGLTELEAGSYVFMDTVYQTIGGKDNEEVYTDFAPSLTVLTTIDSKRHPQLATIDYGNKAIAKPTDKVKDMPWVEVINQGAEYGGLKWGDGHPELKLGGRVEIYCSNLDMSTNAFDRYFVARGNQIVDVWPIMGRSGAAQR